LVLSGVENMTIQILYLFLHFVPVIRRESRLFVEVLATILRVVLLHEHLRQLHLFIVHRIELRTNSL
jgi:hypothetical protein